MKSYLITGITSGIGKAILMDLIKTNIIFGIYRDDSKFAKLKEELGEYSYNLHGVKIDLSKPNLVSKQIPLITSKIDGFIYCAGLAETRPLKLSDYEFNKNIFDVNYFSFIELIRVLLINKSFSEKCSIIVLSSVASQSGQIGKITYSGSKGALESSIKSIAVELIKNKVRINAIRAGMVDTEILSNYKDTLGANFLENIHINQPLGIISKDEIVFLIKYLLSDLSSKITGNTINLDAGWLL